MLALAAASLTASRKWFSTSAPRESLTLGVSAPIHSLSTIVAHLRGFLRDEGLDVTLKHYPSGKAALPGVDAATGLRMLHDRAERYAELLRQLVDGNAADVVSLRACLNSGDTAQARRLAHTIKGAAGTLGAVRLQTRAAELEAALRAGQTDAEIAALMDALEAAQVELAAAVYELP
ncbi:MAG: PAS domain-containing protein [Rhodocyclaceae bacterium]|nr:MAG: PAS domain-containing protein [Rhodocyclaceae bacterium]TND01057.1 MAG: PAS domain-containing protein [Rhodocyclaceae bacterium]